MSLKYAKMQTHCFSLSFEMQKQSLNILKLLSNPKLCLKSTRYTLLIGRFHTIFTNIFHNSILFYHKFSGYLVNIKNIPVLMGLMNLESTPLDQYYSFCVIFNRENIRLDQYYSFGASFNRDSAPLDRCFGFGVLFVRAIDPLSEDRYV